MLDLNLIRLFTFYLAVMFLLGTMRRYQQYHTIGSLAIGMPNRWPRVLTQIRKHRMMFITWAVLRPLILALMLIVANMICARLIFPQANLTTRDLLNEWWMLPILLPSLAGMIGVDIYFVIRVGQVDRRETEKYLDEAEHWLRSWKAPLVSVFTLGYINPRQMVDDEVRKALEQGKGLVSWALWWVSLQTGLRLLFGLLLWLAWAVHPEPTG
jgi:hypothetical protein